MGQKNFRYSQPLLRTSEFTDFFGELPWIFGPCSTPNSRIYVGEPQGFFWGHATVYKLRGFVGELPRIRGPWGTQNSRFYSGYPPADLAIQQQRVRGFMTMRATDFFYQVYCVEEKRGLDQSVIINIIRANWASARELTRPSWDSRVGLTLLKCVYFSYIVAGQRHRQDSFNFYWNHTIMELHCRPGIPADMNFFC